MVGIINNLYNLSVCLLAGCVIILVASVIYAVGIIKYSRKYRIVNEEFEKIKINKMVNKENI